MARIRLSPEIAAETLFLSDRTCCVCRDKTRKVEIHHLDEDASNNDLSNLIVLCKDCHSEAHTTHAFARNLNPLLLRKYNDSWRQIVKSRETPSGILEIKALLEQERMARLTLESKLAPRRLSSFERNTLITALKPFGGQKCTISYALGISESDVYADDFVKVFDAAGWDHNGLDGIRGVIWKDQIIGIQVTVPRGPDPSTGMVTPGAGALIKTMTRLGLSSGPNEFYTDPAIPMYTVDLRVGTK